MGKVSTSMRSALVLVASFASLAVAQQQGVGPASTIQLQPGQFSVFGQPRQQPVNIPGTQGQVVAQFIDETGQAIPIQQLGQPQQQQFQPQQQVFQQPQQQQFQPQPQRFQPAPQPQPSLSSSNSARCLSSSQLPPVQDRSPPPVTSLMPTEATSKSTSRTLPSNSSSSALSRGKPSVSSKQTPLLHEPLSRLLPSPSASSPLLSPRGSQHLSLSVFAPAPQQQQQF